LNRQFEALLRTASRPFLRSGIYPWQFARWKLRLDPVFHTLLRGGHFPDHGRLLDVGCGQGVLLALLVSAREQYRRGEWPADWAPPPLNLELQGLERRRDRVRVARRALRENAQVERCDVRQAAFPRCSAIAMLDLLLYLAPDDQRRLLERCAAALDPGGLLLLREADAAAGLSYQFTRWGARLSAVGSGGIWPRVHCRSSAQWTTVLEALGFSVSVTEPMSAGTPFANVLFVCRKRDK
jgi:cyclopropane fatty-acyl-phospholipid synthase-like methyltransferase